MAKKIGIREFRRLQKQKEHDAVVAFLGGVEAVKRDEELMKTLKPSREGMYGLHGVRGPGGVPSRKKKS